MKKFKIISDPKTGQTTFIPPSILSADWWQNRIIIFREKLYRWNVRIWNGGLLLWWYRLWIRKDEFAHPSLILDHELLSVLPKNKRKKYQADLTRRRQLALQKNDPDMQTPRYQEISQKAALIRKKFNIKSRYPKNIKPLDETIDEIIAENQ